jgi:tetratricopeptide (TPR) repeat protein
MSEPTTTMSRLLETLEQHSELVERAALLVVGLLSWRAASVLWESGTTATSTLSLTLMLAGFLAGFAALLLAVIRGLPAPLRRCAIPTILLLVLGCYAQRYHLAQLENGVLTADVRLYMDYAARVLSRGENPYTTDLYDAFRLNRAPFNLTTTLLDGDVTGRVAYPALSFLVFVPFQLLGISPDWVYPMLLLLTLALVYRGSVVSLRPLALLPFFVDPRYIHYALGGVSDIGWALLLMVMVHYWRAPRVRAIFYGLACAYKHQPWILAPFLLLRLWHETPPAKAPWRQQLRPLLTFSAISLAAFALVNLPFFVWSPAAWLRGVFEPVVAPMITFGQGLSALTMFGRVNIPKNTYTLMMIATLLVSLWVYHRHYRQLRLLLWIAPGLLLWFSNRSLTSYWYFYLLPLLYELTRSTDKAARSHISSPSQGDEASGAPEATAVEADAEPTSWRSTASVAAGWATMVVAIVLYYGSSPSPYTLAVHYPIHTAGHHVRTLSVSLRNGGSRPLQPRFTAQASGQQPFYWRVRSGPRVLRPGETARYEIYTRSSFAAFELRRGARITAADTRSSSRRVTAEIAPERTYIHPDTIPNGDYRFWTTRTKTPAFWGLIQQPQGAGRVAVVRPPKAPGAPRRALSLQLDPAKAASLALDTYLALPRTPLQVIIRRPAGSNKLPDPGLLYGLRLLIDQRHVLVLFGDRAGQGKLPDGVPYVMFAAPPERWSHQRIDLPAVLARLRIAPLPQRVSLPRFEHLDLPCVPLNLELYLATKKARAVSGLFGPLRATEARSAVLARYPLDGHHRLAPLLWRGSYNLELRNYVKARAAFAQAAKLAPTQPSVHLKHGEAEFWLGRWRSAIKAYARALKLSPAHPLAYKGIGWAHYNLGEYPDALLAWRSAQRAFEKTPGRWLPAHVADTLKGLALVYLRKGDCEKARRAMSHARERMPTVELPWAALATCGQDPATPKP